MGLSDEDLPEDHEERRSPEEEAREERLFHEAMSLPQGADREAFLSNACGDDHELQQSVRGLLEAAEGLAGFLAEAPTPIHNRPQHEQIGDVLDRYRLVEKIGEGGCGVVYRADHITEDLPPVAIKVVRPGMGTSQVLARFAMEQRALSILNHPGVARVMDSGTAPSGRPYFVMEWVDGEPITAYADAHQLGIRERLDLFRELCVAVQHAHQKGVIHRDIKPSNVLVTLVDGRPTPKVIDFGIVKAIHEDVDFGADVTLPGLVVGTPRYMSPEQSDGGRMDVDARSDIYSLGVVLFELLTGSTPLDPHLDGGMDLAELRRLSEITDTPKPSHRAKTATDAVAEARDTDTDLLGRDLENDLDWIVLKALSSDREQRYPSAWEFGEDVRRFLQHEPVTAGPPSWRYRTGKFVLRHRAIVVGATVALATLIASMVAVTASYLSAEEARADLAKSNRSLRKTMVFQRAQLSDLDLPAIGVLVRESLLRGAESGMRNQGLDDPEIQRKIAKLDALASHNNFTRTAKSVIHKGLFDPTMNAVEREFSDDPVLRGSMWVAMADTFGGLGLPEQALDAAERALSLQRDAIGEEHHETLTSIEIIGTSLRKLGRLDEAKPYHQKAIAGRTRTQGPNHHQTLTSMCSLANLEHALGNPEAAEAIFAKVLARAEDSLGSEHPETLRFMSNFASFLDGQGRIEDAAETYRRTLERMRNALGPDHRHTLTAAANLGQLLVKIPELTEAEERVREAVMGFRRTLGDDHPDTLTAMSFLSIVLNAQGLTTEAIRYADLTLAAQRRVLGSTHMRTLANMAGIGVMMRNEGRLQEAVALSEEASNGARAAFPRGHVYIGAFQLEYGRALYASERWAECEPVMLEAQEALVTAAGAADPRARAAANALAELYDRLHQNDPNEGHDLSAASWRTMAKQE